MCSAYTFTFHVPHCFLGKARMQAPFFSPSLLISTAESPAELSLPQPRQRQVPKPVPPDGPPSFETSVDHATGDGWWKKRKLRHSSLNQNTNCKLGGYKLLNSSNLDIAWYTMFSFVPFWFAFQASSSLPRLPRPPRMCYWYFASDTLPPCWCEPKAFRHRHYARVELSMRFLILWTAVSMSFYTCFSWKVQVHGDQLPQRVCGGSCSISPKKENRMSHKDGVWKDMSWFSLRNVSSSVFHSTTSSVMKELGWVRLETLKCLASQLRFPNCNNIRGSVAYQ